MFKIYTPKAWYATFSYPSLYIEDDGRIFGEDEYYNMLRNAAGKIDFASGYVYGPDYCVSGSQPIGKIVHRDNGETWIYGPDYYKSFAQPILYIRDNRIFEADEFYSMFPREAGYIKAELPKEPVSYQSRSSTPSETASKVPEPSGLGSKLKGLLAIGVVIAILIFIPIMMAQDSTYGVPAMVMLGIGSVLALIFAKSYGGSIAIICVTCGILMFIYDYIATSSHKTIGTGELIISILLYPFIICLAFLIPSAIMGGLVMLVKRLFLKNKEGKKDRRKFD